MPLSRLEIQNKLIAKYGNPLNEIERKSFEKANIKTLLIPKVISDRLPKVSNTIGEGENAKTTEECIIGNSVNVHHSLVTVLFLAIEKLTKNEDLKNELQGKIICFDPALMPESETTIAYTSWGLAFRFNQENVLSENASKFFTDLGFKIGIDKDNKQYFISDIEKLIR